MASEETRANHAFQGLQGIEDFNRKNYERLSLQAGQISGRISLPDDLGTRRANFFASNIPNPETSIGDHFPDPLFGAAGTRFFEQPNQQRQDDFPRLRQFSFASAPECSTEPLETADSTETKKYSTSLSDIPMFVRSGRDVFDEDLSIRSVPDLSLSTHHDTGRIESDRLMPTRDIEPIPLKNINLPGAKKASSSMSGVAKKEETDDHIPASSVRTAKLSKDLVECLGKMTYHNIADDALFEPLPLGGPEPTKIGSMDEGMKQPAEEPPSSIHAGIFNRDIMMEDDSEHDDEFAEG